MSYDLQAIVRELLDAYGEAGPSPTAEADARLARARRRLETALAGRADALALLTNPESGCDDGT
jgi:hypothetical protein